MLLIAVHLLLGGTTVTTDGVGSTTSAEDMLPHRLRRLEPTIALDSTGLSYGEIAGGNVWLVFGAICINWVSSIKTYYQ